MGRKKTGTTIEGNTISGTAEEITSTLERVSKRLQRKGQNSKIVVTTIPPEQKTIEIISAAIKDSFCNYSYELKTGPTVGDTITRKGASIIHNDMRFVFSKLGAHLAVICEEISAADIGDIDSIEKFNDIDHPEGGIEHRVSHFNVHSFAIEGTGEKEGVVLNGEKRLSTGEYVKLTAPKKTWFGEYAFINELRVVIDDCKAEVEQYMNGKTAPKFVQTEMPLDEVEKDEE